MSGWIKLHRGLFEHWIASDPDFLSVWVRMLTEANFEDKRQLFNGSLLDIKRGQIIFGLDAWSAKTGVGISKLRRLLFLLENDSMINRQKTNKFSLISIVNYEKYQCDDRQDADNQQADDRPPATPKEPKNKRNKDNINISDKLDFSGWPQQPDPEILKAWLAMRKRVKASCSQLAMNTIGNELAKAVQSGFSVDQCLRQAEASGWKGFKSSWVKTEEQRNGYQNGAGLNRHEKLQQWSVDTTERLERELASLREQEDAGISGNGQQEFIPYIPDVDS